MISSLFFLVIVFFLIIFSKKSFSDKKKHLFFENLNISKLLDIKQSKIVILFLFAKIFSSNVGSYSYEIEFSLNQFIIFFLFVLLSKQKNI